MRRTLLVILVAGCASSGGATNENSTPRQATILMGGDAPGTAGSRQISGDGIMAERPRATAAIVAAGTQDVWVAVKKVYAQFEIPLTVENPASHQLGNPNFYKSHEMGGKPMSQFADCGSGMDGPKATSYRIYMSLLTTVEPDGKGGTKIQTTFVPMAQDIAGGSSDRIPCGSTGRFEQLVNDDVKLAVATK